MDKQMQIELELLAFMVGAHGYRYSSDTIREEVRHLHARSLSLKEGFITANEFAVYLMQSVEFVKNQL